MRRDSQRVYHQNVEENVPINVTTLIYEEKRENRRAMALYIYISMETEYVYKIQRYQKDSRNYLFRRKTLL